MLVFNFRNETVGTELVLRPRLMIQISNKNMIITTGSALLDSGADRTVIPEYIADVLGLQKGNMINTLGIGGITRGYESVLNITFIDNVSKKEEILDVPVYVLAGLTDVVIGRRKIFDEYSITFEQFNNKIILEKK